MLYETVKSSYNLNEMYRRNILRLCGMYIADLRGQIQCAELDSDGPVNGGRNILRLYKI